MRNKMARRLILKRLNKKANPHPVQEAISTIGLEDVVDTIRFARETFDLSECVATYAELSESEDSSENPTVGSKPNKEEMMRNDYNRIYCAVYDLVHAAMRNMWAEEIIIDISEETIREQTIRLLDQGFYSIINSPICDRLVDVGSVGMSTTGEITYGGPTNAETLWAMDMRVLPDRIEETISPGEPFEDVEITEEEKENRRVSYKCPRLLT